MIFRQFFPVGEGNFGLDSFQNRGKKIEKMHTMHNCPSTRGHKHMLKCRCSCPCKNATKKYFFVICVLAFGFCKAKSPKKKNTLVIRSRKKQGEGKPYTSLVFRAKFSFPRGQFWRNITVCARSACPFYSACCPALRAHHMSYCRDGS